MSTSVPSVSIALATYNGADYLEKQLESILHQTWKDLEIIASDDGSTDDTWEILSRYARNYPGIRIFQSHENRGYLKNFEFAISQCSGDYIALCDQDDEWSPEKIETLMSLIGNHDMAVSDLRLIDADGNEIAPSMEKYQGLYVPSNEDMFKTLIIRNCFTGCAMLFTRTLAEKCIPIPEAALVHDWWLAINAASGNGITYTSRPLVSYRQHKKNAIGAKNKRDESIGNRMNLFDQQRRKYMNKRFSDFTLRIESYLDSKIFTGQEKQYLQEVLQYYKGYLSFKTKWKTIYYGFKHRKYIAKHGNFIIKILQLLAKLV